MENYRRLSGFAMTIVIIDLVMCILRLPLVTLGGLALVSGADLGPIRQTASFEIVSGIGILVFGTLGNILILAKKPLGVSLGWTSFGFFLMSFLTGIWQGWIKVDSYGNGAEKIAVLIGVALAVVFRVVLGSLYAAALLQARKSLEPLAAEAVPYEYSAR